MNKNKCNKSIFWLFIAIWILGFTASYGYKNRYIQIFILPLIVLISYYLIILVHEFIHFLVALILKIDTKGFSCNILSLMYMNKSIKIKIKNPFNNDLTGCTYINCGRITNEGDLEKFKKKVFWVTILAPIYNYLLTSILIYLSLKSHQNLILKGVVIVSIILSINVTIGDIYTAYLYSKNRDFLINTLIETEIISNSFNLSEAKDYLISELNKSIDIFKYENIDIKKYNYKLINYNKLLYLCIAGEVSNIDPNIFSNLKNYLINIDFKENILKSNLSFNNADVLINSMLYSALVLNNISYTNEFMKIINDKKIIQYYTNESLKKPIYNFINNSNIEISNIEYKNYTILDKKIIKRIRGRFYEENSSLCGK